MIFALTFALTKKNKSPELNLRFFGNFTSRSWTLNLRCDDTTAHGPPQSTGWDSFIEDRARSCTSRADSALSLFRCKKTRKTGFRRTLKILPADLRSLTSLVPFVKIVKITEVIYSVKNFSGRRILDALRWNVMCGRSCTGCIFISVRRRRLRNPLYFRPRYRTRRNSCLRHSVRTLLLFRSGCCPLLGSLCLCASFEMLYLTAKLFQVWWRRFDGDILNGRQKRFSIASAHNSFLGIFRQIS